jgi:hypothetical protein
MVGCTWPQPAAPRPSLAAPDRTDLATKKMELWSPYLAAQKN